MRHNRNMSGSHNRYTTQVPPTLAPSTLYSQQRMSIPASYYTVSSAPSGMQLQPSHQQEYDPDPTASIAPVSLPPQHRASSGAWTQHDDQQLLRARMQGLNWGQIHSTYFPAKSANACRKRHERLMDRKDADDWDNRKLQRLAKEYMGMRKEIWSGLAARTGEKWSVVEQKCMSNGIKNLQSASRAASRRDRLEAAAPLTGYDDDSGISGIALTPVDELDPSYSSPETASTGGPHSASSSASVAAYQHQLQTHAQAHLQPLGGGAASAYGYAGGYATNAHHGYSSSVSSTASQSYGGHAGAHNSSGSYMTERMPSADMGIDAIINRPGRRV